MPNMAKSKCVVNMLILEYYKLLREMSKKECDRIYEFAMKRSEDIINGVDYREEVIEEEGELEVQEVVQKPRKRFRTYSIRNKIM